MSDKTDIKIPMDFNCPRCLCRQKILIWRQNCEFTSGICETCWEKLYNDIENKIIERLNENGLLCDTQRFSSFRNKLDKLNIS